MRRESAKANRVGFVGGVQSHLSLFSNLQMRAVVDRRGSVQSNAGVSVLVIVKREEAFAEHPRVFETSEARREGRAVLERLEGRFGEGVVVALTG